MKAQKFISKFQYDRYGVTLDVNVRGMFLPGTAPQSFNGEWIDDGSDDEIIGNPDISIHDEDGIAVNYSHFSDKEIYEILQLALQNIETI